MRHAAGGGQGHEREREDRGQQRGVEGEHTRGERPGEHDAVEPVMQGAKAGVKDLGAQTDDEVPLRRSLPRLRASPKRTDPYKDDEALLS